MQKKKPSAFFFFCKFDFCFANLFISAGKCGKIRNESNRLKLVQIIHLERFQQRIQSSRTKPQRALCLALRALHQTFSGKRREILETPIVAQKVNKIGEKKC